MRIEEEDLKQNKKGLETQNSPNLYTFKSRNKNDLLNKDLIRGFTIKDSDQSMFTASMKSKNQSPEASSHNYYNKDN